VNCCLGPTYNEGGNVVRKKEGDKKEEGDLILDFFVCRVLSLYLWLRRKKGEREWWGKGKIPDPGLYRSWKGGGEDCLRLRFLFLLSSLPCGLPREKRGGPEKERGGGGRGGGRGLQ